MIPTTMVWKDKYHLLGSLVLVAEALGRHGEEMADRIAWNTVIDLGLDDESLRHLQRTLGELRVVHSTFSMAVDNRLMHAAIVLFIRVASFAYACLELVVSPKAHTLDWHMQQLGFTCDFANFVLEPYVNPHASAAPSSSVHALYANETWVRAILFVMMHTRTPLRHATLVSLHKHINDRTQTCSTVWLKRQLLRLAAGLKVAIAHTDHTDRPTSVSLILSTLARDRGIAINAYAKKHGHEEAISFDDPLFDLTDQMAAKTQQQRRPDPSHSSASAQHSPAPRLLADTATAPVLSMNESAGSDELSGSSGGDDEEAGIET
jgi:hypothetical protein